ncbi:MAG: hypothetical protein HY560_01920, partial [Gemmatimonadetes bacterium]|nr:hypothetical protein [Gemmatimonadota bacterium]
MTKIGFPLRRAGAGLLLLLWLDVATANVAACAFDSAIGAEPAQPTAVHPLAAHATGHTTPAVAARGACGLPQLLVVDCIPPELLAPPVLADEIVPAKRAAPHPVASPHPRLE